MPDRKNWRSERARLPLSTSTMTLHHLSAFHLSAFHAARCVTCHGEHPHSAPVVLVGERSIPVA